MSEANEREAELAPDSPMAFESWVRPHLSPLLRLCRALCRSDSEAEDLFQQALVKAYLRRRSFVAKGSLLGWLCSITRNEFIEQRRQERRRAGLFENVIQGGADVIGSLFGGGTASADPEESASRGEQASVLMHCLRRLPEGYRLVVLLCDIEELSYEETARALQLPIGTVKSRHHRGRAQLAELYRDVEGGEAVASAGGAR